MTREEAKKLSNVLKAYSEGKIIQYQQNDTHRHADLRFYDCSDQDNITFNVKEYNYRIKPEPEYRPFETKEECWEEMHKHSSFWWVKDKDSKSQYRIRMVGHGYILIRGGDLSFFEAFDRFNFVDGTPFGIIDK